MLQYRNTKRNPWLTYTLDDGTKVPIMTSEQLQATCTSNSESSTISVNEYTFQKQSVVKIEFFDTYELLYIPPYFGYNFSNLQNINSLPQIIEEINAHFLAGCTSFNSNIVMYASVLGPSFLEGCTKFNSSISTGRSVTRIDSCFLYKCSSFNQSIDFCKNTTIIGTYFLAEMDSFNKTLDMTRWKITEFPGFSIYKLKSFNKSISLPYGITKIGNWVIYDLPVYANTLAVLPSSVPSFSTTSNYFCCECPNFTGKLTWNTNFADAIPNNSYFKVMFVNDDSTCRSYTSGIKIDTYNSNYLRNKLPDNANSNGYRKFVTV